MIATRLLKNFMELKMDNCLRAYRSSLIMRDLLEELAKEKSLDATSELRCALAEMETTKVNPCRKCASCYDFEFYMKTYTNFLSKKLTTSQLNNELHNWSQTQLTDDALYHFKQAQLSIKPRNKIEIKKLRVYLDTNILCDKERKTQEKLHKMKNFVQFFYSPSHLEEIHKIPNKEDRSSIIKEVSLLTDNIGVFRTLDELNTFFEEDINLGIKRVEDTDKSTKALEKRKLSKAEERAMYFPEYNTEEHKRNIANKNDILNSLSEEEFKKISEKSETSTLTTKDCFKNIEQDKVVIHHLYTLSYMLDFLGYKIDKKEKTIRSSLHDIEHLSSGFNSDIFVTNDDKLKNRAKQIYGFMESPIKVFSLEEFINFYKYELNKNET